MKAISAFKTGCDNNASQREFTCRTRSKSHRRVAALLQYVELQRCKEHIGRAGVVRWRAHAGATINIDHAARRRQSADMQWEWTRGVAASARIQTQFECVELDRSLEPVNRSLKTARP